MGKRLTIIEKEQIEKLVSEGLTNREIAEKLGRTETAVRNIRYREGLKALTANQLPTLIRERDQLKGEIYQLTTRKNQLSGSILGLQTRREEVSKALLIDENILQTRLSRSLLELKQKKPELFYISGEEQIAKITGQLLGSLLRYLIT